MNDKDLSDMFNPTHNSYEKEDDKMDKFTMFLGASLVVGLAIGIWYVTANDCPPLECK